MKPKHEGKIIVFSAPSGGGKSTLLAHLRSELPGLVYSISVTTRRPRAGEIQGVHYFFMDEQEFRDRAGKGEFAEWQEVHGNYYGTPKAFIDQMVAWGRHVVMDIDVKGKQQFDETYPEAVGVLILPPSSEGLEQRLRARGTDSEEAIATRLANARQEIDFAQREGKYEHTIVNDDLEQAKDEVVRLVTSILASEP